LWYNGRILIMDCAKCAYQDKQRWADENATDFEGIEKMMRGDYDIKLGENLEKT